MMDGRQQQGSCDATERQEKWKWVCSSGSREKDGVLGRQESIVQVAALPGNPLDAKRISGVIFPNPRRSGRVHLQMRGYHSASQAVKVMVPWADAAGAPLAFLFS